jgi:hypothetical protein
MDRGLHELLGTFHPSILLIAARLHDLVYALCPDASMEAHVRLKQLQYRRQADTRPFCSVELHKGVVKLHFLQGDLLKDPEHLLKGSGRCRRIILHSATQAGADAVRDLLCQAIALSQAPGGPRPYNGRAVSSPAGSQEKEGGKAPAW